MVVRGRRTVPDVPVSNVGLDRVLFLEPYGFSRFRPLTNRYIRLARNEKQRFFVYCTVSWKLRSLVHSVILYQRSVPRGQSCHDASRNNGLKFKMSFT